jgi:hypothetical protein
MHQEPVPDFFQEEDEAALRLRVQWLSQQVGLNDSFFGKLLRLDEPTFIQWKRQEVDFRQSEQRALHEFWDAMMHVLSFLNFDTERARRLLDHVPPAARPGRILEPPLPWADSSLRSHLETHGMEAIEDVSRWITSFRFGAPTLTPEPEVTCPSTTD